MNGLLSFATEAPDGPVPLRQPTAMPLEKLVLGERRCPTAAATAVPASSPPETDEQRQFLEDNGCHDYQDCFLGHPVPDQVFESLGASFDAARPEVGGALAAPPAHAVCVNAGKAFATIASDAVRQIRK